MTEKSVFISSCSRRQLARRRLAREVWRLRVAPAALFLAMAGVAYLAGRGSF